MKEKLEEGYGFLFEQELLDEILQEGFIKSVIADDQLINIGDYVKHMPLLLSGSIKIMREDDDGDELLLYYLERGDTCAMTMTCCMGESKSEIRAIAEQDTELIMIPVQFMSEWISKYQSWKSFVFESYNSRLSEMLSAIDSLAFDNMSERVLKFLNDKVKITGDTTLDLTHQEIAHDLHTSRVVISRILKVMEKQGEIKLFRNRIQLLSF
ncbi:MAG: CRP/FNR family transcriptional regulator [Parvicellaceae bacterium]|jgi:CRP/FNR family transcriptional regulator